ncbi:MAG TPA: PIN domain-containing protein [Burkholderiaceae bacterium]|nr:PIN domain-containing protein [Burkholderiaceae bacterium]
MKAVLDTNVWLDWLVFDDPSAQALGRAAEAGGLVLPATAETRAEWLDVIARPRFRLDDTALEAAVRRFDLHASLVDVETIDSRPAADRNGRAAAPAVPLACRDPDDQKFIELALATSAPFLVTRDRDLLRLARSARNRHGLRILDPEAADWREALLRTAA